MKVLACICTVNKVPWTCDGMLISLIRGFGCRRKGHQYQQRFKGGEATGPLQDEPLPKGSKRKGTCIRFLYDRTVFAKK